MANATPNEQFLSQLFVSHPRLYGNRFTTAAERHLQENLFHSLAKHRQDYLRLFFPDGPPANSNEPWSLRAAQGAVDGAEYTAAAKGTACGHIFKSGESTYNCKTCAADDTCVLCARCYEASDHEGHNVFISVSPGNSGCCDCGDREAWRREVNCTIHTADDASPLGRLGWKDKAPVGTTTNLPVDLVEAIRMTIARAADYLCDVFSCCPEQTRMPKTADSVTNDERRSKLGGRYGIESMSEDPDGDVEYALILWNDEKHTVHDVQNQVARACAKPKKFGLTKAMEVNDVGRSVITYSTDLPELLHMAEIIEQLKVTVTIRSARDTYREHMCGAIIEWISDIAGCSVGDDAHILRNIVCEELLNPWRMGSHATNKDVGMDGLFDHETEDQEKARREYQIIFRRFNINPRIIADPDSNDDNDDDDEDDDEEYYEEDDDEAEFMGEFDPVGDDGMDIVVEDIQQVQTPTALATVGNEMDIDFLEGNEEVSEAFERALADIRTRPPPPPPPVAGHRRRMILTPAESDDGDADQTTVRPASDEPFGKVPATPKPKVITKRPLRPSKHWLEKPEGYRGPRPSKPCEDLWQRVRLDFLVLYDLRLWKVLRIQLRHLYITTVVTVPQFKRLLGLRFAALYTVLAQLYLIGDREPDHSIINLSVQMLTTPTITQEVVERGNFMTNLMAILYTFLTTRQVGFPEDVSPRATLAFDTGAITNRRMFHFFLDLRWLFQSEFIHYRMRVEQRYLLQFLDIAKLHQGVCPNVRQTGDHVEYESDIWISAGMIVKEVNKLCKLVASSFEPRAQLNDSNADLSRALRTVAQVVMINSYGFERKRFQAAEVKDEMPWHSVGPFEDSGKEYNVPAHVVQDEPMSFHHPLHYLFSWLIENAKDLSRDDLRTLLRFAPEDLKDPWNPHLSYSLRDVKPDDLLSVIFDHPLRVCAWLAQMKAGMWVRNGISLRHQAHSYRGVGHRDVGYQRDILLIQTALVLCGSQTERPGERFLAQMIDRFQLVAWFQGDYSVVSGFEELQQLEVIEDFFHLLVVALSERGNLVPNAVDEEQHEKILEHDIAHALCFKPLSFSEIAGRVTEKVGDSDEFNRVLERMTTYRAPEGLNDTGTFELKPEYIELIDPYYAHYSRNQREEAEGIYRKHMARKKGTKPEDVVFEPKMQTILWGLFAHLAAFTATPIFAQVIAMALNFAASVHSRQTNLQVTRIETFLHMVLHLAMIATTEDKTGDQGFVEFAAIPQRTSTSVVVLLLKLLEMDDYASCHPTMREILKRMVQTQPKVSLISGPMGAIFDRSDNNSPASLSLEDKDRKKQEALARQAKIMAQMRQQQNSFLENQGLAGFEDDLDDLDDMSISGEPENIEHKNTWNFPTGTCIWCQEETDDQRLYGMFAFLCESDIVRQTPIKEADFVHEVMITPASLDRSAEHLRPFGVAGQNKHTVEKIDTNGVRVQTERQGLSKGFPHAKHHATGPASTSCGHIMHFSCFELYLQNSIRRHQQQIARDHPENMKMREFTCPLCKALGNTFLPIIWKAKECAQEYELHSAKGLADWLLSLDNTLLAPPTNGDASITEDRLREQISGFQTRASQHINSMFAPTLVTSMHELSLEPSQASPTPQSRLGISQNRRRSLSRIFGVFSNAGGQGSVDNPSPSPQTEQVPRMGELIKAYQRIDETIEANEFSLPDEVDESTTWNPVSQLSRALALSISAFEIAHRGTGSDPLAMSLLADLPEQVLTHFRVLSETVESYLAVNVLRPNANNPVAHQNAKRRECMLWQLFGTFPGEDTEPGNYLIFFGNDMFLFYADWLALAVPSVAEASSMMQLCYWAEIVKVLFTALKLVQKNPTGIECGTPVTPEFKRAVDEVLHETLDPEVRPHLTEAYLAFVQQFVEKYALAFLRKCIVLMRVRYGLDFECPYNLDPESPELDRLTALLHLPHINGLYGLYTSGEEAGNRLRVLTSEWFTTTLSVAGMNDTWPILSHPAIFELVGLPKNYDTLTEEAMKRKCPTTGKELSDPAICLFCGEIFCSQAVCCVKDKTKGGCYQHMQRCGSQIGAFINIRKCMVFLKHGELNGSWLNAPYLDRHGEPDPTLRKHHPLYLNQKRYDKLIRDAWLQHQIPTVIARKLEADINPGGWETL